MPPFIRTRVPLPISDDQQELPIELWRFLAAVDAGDLQTLQIFFNVTPWALHPQVLTHRDEHGHNLLLRAVRGGHLQIVSYLLDDLNAGPFPSYGDENYEALYPIHLAADMGHLDLVKYFIGKYPELCLILDSAHNTVIHRAAQFGHTHIVNYLVEETDFQFIDRVGEQGCQPLGLAAMWGFLETCQYLVEKGADIFFKNEMNRNACVLAICSGNLEVVRYFIKIKPELLDVEDEFELYPIHVAAVCNQIEILKFFVEECDQAVDRKSTIGGWTPLAVAIAEDEVENMDAILYLLNKGAALTVRVSDNLEPLLHLAVQSRRFKVIEELLKRNKDLALIKNRAGLDLLEYVTSLIPNNLKRSAETQIDELNKSI